MPSITPFGHSQAAGLPDGPAAAFILRAEAGWNEAVGPSEIRFLFKLQDGTIRILTLSKDTEAEIAALCSQLNNEPPERTRDVLRYLATNAYYAPALAEWYGVGVE